RLLEVGSRCGVPKTAGTCRDILKRRKALWTFVQVEGVEPTNNTAERSLRPGVLWRKGSFGTQSAAGSRFVESMMTVVATLKQQQRNVLEYLTAACEAALLKRCTKSSSNLRFYEETMCCKLDSAPEPISPGATHRSSPCCVATPRSRIVDPVPHRFWFTG